MRSVPVVVANELRHEPLQMPRIEDKTRDRDTPFAASPRTAPRSHSPSAPVPAFEPPRYLDSSPCGRSRCQDAVAIADKKTRRFPAHAVSGTPANAHAHTCRSRRGEHFHFDRHSSISLLLRTYGSVARFESGFGDHLFQAAWVRYPPGCQYHRPSTIETPVGGGTGAKNGSPGSGRHSSRRARAEYAASTAAGAGNRTAATQTRASSAISACAI